MPNTNDFELYSIHSQKGGVGKTSISLVLAGISSILLKKKTIILDLDMTGSSLVNVPNVLKASDHFPGFFMNDFLLSEPTDHYSDTNIFEPSKLSQSRLSKAILELAGVSGLSYISSNPDINEVKKIVPLMAQEDRLGFFRYRIENIIAAVACLGFEVVILDNSPGLFGISNSLLSMIKEQESQESRLRKMIGVAFGDKPDSSTFATIFCSSIDEADYQSLIPSAVKLVLSCYKAEEDILKATKSVNFVLTKYPKGLIVQLSMPKSLRALRIINH